MTKLTKKRDHWTRVFLWLAMGGLVIACGTEVRRDVPPGSDSVARSDSAASDASDDLTSTLPSATAFPDTTGWTSFVSRRWGFSFSYPNDATARVLGPRMGDCLAASDTSSADEMMVEGAAADSVRAVFVTYSMLPFDSIALREGFRPLPTGWVLAFGDDAEAEKPVIVGPLSILSGSQPQRTYSDAGSAAEQATRTLGVLRRPDGCAVVLVFDEIESRGAALQAYAAFRTLAFYR